MTQENRDLFRYTAPFILFLALTYLQGSTEGETLFILYAAKTIICGLFFIYCFRQDFSELKGKFELSAVLLGVLIFAAWILRDFISDVPREVTFDVSKLEQNLSGFFLIASRILGAVILVPLLEEIFWRSFLMRWIVDANFTKIKLGHYDHRSFWITTLAFMSVHYSWQWPEAAFAGICFGGYLVYKKNLFGCILAHAVANLLLAGYVLIGKNYHHW